MASLKLFGKVGPVNTLNGGSIGTNPLDRTTLGDFSSQSLSTLGLTCREINWNNPSKVPSELLSLTVNQILEQILFATVNTSTSISFSAQTNCNGSIEIHMTSLLIPSGSRSTRNPDCSFIQSGPEITKIYRGQNGTYNITDNTGFAGVIDPLTIQGLAQSCPATQVNFFVTLNVEVTLNCASPDALETPICLNICTADNTNLTSCRDPYRDYCFGELGATNVPIETSSNCREFFQDYNENVGPDSSVDTRMSAFCNTKYGISGFNGLLNTPGVPAIDIELCACHMPPHYYDEYAKSVESEFPGFGKYISNSGIDQRCLLAKCVDPGFKTSIIGKTCKIPQCLNIAAFNNNGSVDKSKITINQKQGNCENIASGDDSGGGDNGGGVVQNTRSWIDHHWIWIVLGVGILIVLIIIILIIVAGESHKKPQKSKIDQYKTQ